MAKPVNPGSVLGGRLPVMLFSTLKGLAVSILLILLFTVFVWMGALPDSYLWVFGGLSAVLGSFASGFLCVRKLQWKALLLGVLTGALFFVLLYLLGAIFFARLSTEAAGFLIYLVISVCGGAVGSIAAVSLRRRLR